MSRISCITQNTQDLFSTHYAPYYCGYRFTNGKKNWIWLGDLLQPLVKKGPGCIKDTKELLKTMDGFEREPLLYCIVLHCTLLHLYIPMVTTLLLSHNFFCFNGEFYLQVLGCLMEACFFTPHWLI